MGGEGREAKSEMTTGKSVKFSSKTLLYCTISHLLAPPPPPPPLFFSFQDGL